MDAAILGEYDGLRGRYDAFRKYLESLLPQLIAAEKIQPHKIESRLKSRQRLEEKIGRPGKSYSQLADITDICGARIITYFAADVDAVASLLEREFAIDKAHSIDRRQDLDPNRFGYASLHYVISLSSETREIDGVRFVERIQSGSSSTNNNSTCLGGNRARSRLQILDSRAARNQAPICSIVCSSGNG